jgi:Uma2 family endonuclease
LQKSASEDSLASMTAIPEGKVSADEYLVFEEAAETRHEFVDGSIVAMSGGTYSHAQIVDNLILELNGRMKGKLCRVASTNLRVKVEFTGSYFYPDLVGYSGRPEFESTAQCTLLNPVILFEVLSNTTSVYDRVKKFRQYQLIPSMQEYALVSESYYSVEIFSRGRNGEWIYRSYFSPEKVVRFASIDCSVSIADIYRDVEFQPEEEAS